MHRDRRCRALCPSVAGRYWVDGGVGPPARRSPSRPPSQPARLPAPHGSVAPRRLALCAHPHLVALTRWLAWLGPCSSLGPSSTLLNSFAAWTPFHFALGSLLASLDDLFGQAQGYQAHRHLVPLARSHPRLDH